MDGERPVAADAQRQQTHDDVERVLRSLGHARRGKGYRTLLRQVERLKKYHHRTWSYQVRDLEPDTFGHDGPPEWDLDTRTRERYGQPSGWLTDRGWPYGDLANVQAHYWLRWFSLRPDQRAAVRDVASEAEPQVNPEEAQEDDLFTEADILDIYGSETDGLADAPFPGVGWHQVHHDPRISTPLDRDSAPSELLDRLVVPSHLNYSMKDRGTYPGAYGLCPYLLAHLVGGLTDPGDVVWEVTLADAAVAGLVCSALGRKSARLLPAIGSEEPLLLPLPLHDVTDICQDAGDSTPCTGGIKSPSLVVVHLPLPVDAWSIMAHYLCQGLDLARYGLGDRPADHPEMATNEIKLARAVRHRLQVVHGHLRAHGRQDGTFVVVSTPIQGIWPRWTHQQAESLGWDHQKDIRVYEAPPAQVNGDNRQHAPHPGNGSPLPPRLVSIWRVTR